MRVPAALILVASTAAAAPQPSEQDMIAVITIQPRSPEAARYAVVLLDKLRGEGRTDERTEWVDRMLEMPRLLDGREELIVHLQNLQVADRYVRARLAYAAAVRARDVAKQLDACAMFVETARVSTKWSTSVAVRDGFHVQSIANEATMNATVCYLPIVLRAPVLVHAELFGWLTR